MPAVSACPTPQALRQFASGRLPPAQAEPLVEHLQACATCVNAVDTLAAHDPLAVDLAQVRTLPDQADEPVVTSLIEQLSRLGQHATGTDTTLLPRTPAPDPALWDFLAPGQQPDELGRLGHYRVLKVLGAGGMGVVFQAEDVGLKRHVAIKAMRPALAASPTAKQRFVREAQTAAALEHDHVVPIFQVGEDRGIPFIVMPLLKGQSLDARVRAEPALPIAEVLRIGREAALGLAAAHAAGLVHRDIKPANLWLEGESGRVKVLDFGLARPAADDAPLTLEGAIVGTPAYMAPEQAAGQGVDFRCDLFSLGCVLYRLTTGQAPFRAADPVATLVAVATVEPPAPCQVRPDVPRELSELVMHLLEKDPAKRPASAQAVVDTLGTLELQRLPKARRLPASPPGRRRRAVGWLVLAGGLAAALVAGVVLLWPTPHGTVRIETDDPNVAIVFDQAGPTITGADAEPITLRAGAHGFVVKRGNFTCATDKLIVQRGETITLRLDFLAGKLQQINGGAVVGATDLAPLPTAAPPSLPARYKNSLGMEFVLIKGGRFYMGGTNGRVGRDRTIEYDFYLGTHEVTQAQWRQVTGRNPSHFSRTGPGRDEVKDVADADLDRFPVENIPWREARLFTESLAAYDAVDGWTFRLPREAEWEFALRGGVRPNKFDYAFDFYLTKPTRQLRPGDANFDDGIGPKRPRPVGSYPANELGLYDMHGNVWEWCDDREPREEGGFYHVNRGGGWADEPRLVAADFHAIWFGKTHGLGLRVARVPIAVAASVGKQGQNAK